MKRQGILNGIKTIRRVMATAKNGQKKPHPVGAERISACVASAFTLWVMLYKDTYISGIYDIHT